ncbi:MAG: response regulator transcription factor [Roseivirga sp.]|nr:response regulator transcription factor [Roseivirga sp.]
MDQLRRKLNCLIIDNDQTAALNIQTCIQQSQSVELVRSCSSLNQASSVLNVLSIDLVLVDVDDIKLEDLRPLKTSSPLSLLIVMSANPDYQIQAAGGSVFDCLIKPLNESRLQLAMQRVIGHFIYDQDRQAQVQEKKQSGPTILIKSGGNEHKLVTADILYIESDGEYVKYYTPKGKFMALGSLRKLAKLLGEDFVQVHRSYVVNRSFVVAKTRQHIELTGKRMIPIGKTYKNAFQFVSSAVVF